MYGIISNQHFLLSNFMMFSSKSIKTDGLFPFTASDWKVFIRMSCT